MNYFSAETLFNSSFPPILVLMFALALVISALGFFRVLWFISLGYGYSISALSVLVIAAAASLGIWISVAALYGAMAFPLAYHAAFLTRGVKQGYLPLTVIGLIISLSGLLIESFADRQKTEFKKKRPSRFIDTGLFRLVRFPNYFGEMQVWAGSWIAAVPYLTGWSQWLISLAGLIMIELIMVGSAKRLELKQEQRYGEDLDFVSYAQEVPILFPVVPLYSLKRVWLAIGW